MGGGITPDDATTEEKLQFIQVEADRILDYYLDGVGSEDSLAEQRDDLWRGWTRDAQGRSRSR